MEEDEIPSITLNSGYKMPCIGMGTAGHPFPPAEALASFLVDAIEIGYRHFDTAALHEYGTEEAVGLAAKQAWSPLSANGASWGSLAVMESPILKEIAASKQNTVAHIALRWILQQGANPIVKSFNKQRMKENLQLFDFEISEDHLAKIQHKIPQKRVVLGEKYLYENGDYKSLEELWDGHV